VCCESRRAAIATSRPVVGHAVTIFAGEWITASGDWVNDRTHRQQFKARFLRTSAPSSVEGIERYLASGMIRGIRPVYARKMVKAFGEKVFDIIEAEPDRLREVDGIFPNEAAVVRLIGALLLKQNDQWAVQRARYMTLETIAPLGHDLSVSLPLIAA
jgi:ATP-dependent exoDNAse (exonuclease V) alpha subunit